MKLPSFDVPILEIQQSCCCPAIEKRCNSVFDRLALLNTLVRFRNTEHMSTMGWWEVVEKKMSNHPRQMLPAAN